MMSLKPDDGDYETIKHGYLQSRAVLRHVADAAEKWSAVEGTDSAGAPKSGVALLARALTDKLRQDLKGRELVEEAHRIRDDLALLLSGLTPSRDEEEQRARILASARGLAESVRRAMHRRCTGAAFGELMKALAPRPGELEAEVRNAYAIVRSMSVRTSERVRRILCHVLRAWATSAVDRVERTDLGIPRALVEGFVREVCASRRLLPMLGGLVLPYFSRASVDCTLIARVIEVNLSDATLQLFATRERRTPRLPVRLSFSESDAGGGADVIDWGRVELEPEAEDAVRPAALPDLAAVDIVFAGSRAFEDWSARLGELYLENRGARADVAEDDPRTVALRAVLEDLERVYAGAA